MKCKFFFYLRSTEKMSVIDFSVVVVVAVVMVSVVLEMVVV